MYKKQCHKHIKSASFVSTFRAVPSTTLRRGLLIHRNNAVLQVFTLHQTIPWLGSGSLSLHGSISYKYLVLNQRLHGNTITTAAVVLQNGHHPKACQGWTELLVVHTSRERSKRSLPDAYITMCLLYISSFGVPPSPASPHPLTSSLPELHWKNTHKPSLIGSMANWLAKGT